MRNLVIKVFFLALISWGGGGGFFLIRILLERSRLSGVVK